MQLLSPLTRDSKAIEREAAAGRHLPYARHVDDHTLETRDGLYLQFLHLRGLLFETADTDELNYRKRLRLEKRRAFDGAFLSRRAGFDASSIGIAWPD